MRPLQYATSNATKFHQAQHVCTPLGIAIEQQPLEITEIQGEDIELIARDKAEKAYAKANRPLVISDDSWSIPGLNGFPGPYMKSVSAWFGVQDWLNLTRDLADRRIILCQTVVYQDATVQKLFSYKIEGMLLTESRGTSRDSHDTITTFDDDSHTLAELHAQGKSATGQVRNVWHEFAEWYGKSQAQQAK